MAEKLDARKINEEMEQLQLEETRERVAKMRRDKTMQLRRVMDKQMALKRNALIDAQAQAVCVHKKGGKGKENWFNGNDSDYAVVKHILSHGPMIVVCQRCGKLWEPPPLALRTGTTEERREYKRLFIEYKAAMDFPTDNETSGARLFEFTQESPAA
jgi:hypothetical protein